MLICANSFLVSIFIKILKFIELSCLLAPIDLRKLRSNIFLSHMMTFCSNGILPYFRVVVKFLKYDKLREYFKGYRVNLHKTYKQWNGLIHIGRNAALLGLQARGGHFHLGDITHAPPVWVPILEEVDPVASNILQHIL